jgi:hypothetical protein
MFGYAAFAESPFATLGTPVVYVALTGANASGFVGNTKANGEKCVIFWSSVSNDFIKITSSIIAGGAF